MNILDPNFTDTKMAGTMLQKILCIQYTQTVPLLKCRGKKENSTCYPSCQKDFKNHYIRAMTVLTLFTLLVNDSYQVIK